MVEPTNRRAFGLLLTTSWAQPSRFNREPDHSLQRERRRMLGMGFLEGYIGCQYVMHIILDVLEETYC